MPATSTKYQHQTNVHPNGRRIVRLDAGKPRAMGVAVPRRSLSERLPSWKELSSTVEKQGRKGQGFVESITTRRFVLLILVIAAAFTLYIRHVQVTQDLLTEVQRARRENLQLHLKYNRLKGEFDYATSPSVVYERAGALGFEEGYRYETTIRLNTPER
jgi:hypothetical protein